MAKKDVKSSIHRRKTSLIICIICIGIIMISLYLYKSEEIARHLNFRHISVDNDTLTADISKTSVLLSPGAGTTSDEEVPMLRRIGVNMDRQYQDANRQFVVEEQKITVVLWSKSAILVDIIMRCGPNCPCNYIKVNSREEAENADFILIKMTTVPADIKSYKDMFPETVPRHKLVLLHRESPAHTSPYVKQINGFFNFTAYYSYKSDAVFAYGECVKRQYPAVVTRRNHAENKTKFAMWMVSNCKTASNREKYVHELQKYIPIDIYGSCGPLSFPNCHTKGSTVPTDDCFNADQKIIDKYKFYLAFENSICDDYISEKAFRAARGERNPLPIMLGGGSYHKHFPQGSYLDVKNFSSPKALAEYLHFLNQYDDEYNKHFQWKRDYTCEWVSYYCALCQALLPLKNKINVVTNAAQVYDRRQCKSSDVYFKNITFSETPD